MTNSVRYHHSISFLYFIVLAGLAVFITAGLGLGIPTSELEGQALYDALKAFKLQSKATVSNLELKRDLGEMSFTGDFYFPSSVNGQFTGAVFIGEGRFRYKEIESDFETAVLRFTDDTYKIIGKGRTPVNTLPDRASDLAREFEPRFLKESGANISARLAISLANSESPGFFLAQFDKGKLDRFGFLIDPQCRILNDILGFDTGEKAIFFRCNSRRNRLEAFKASYIEKDFAEGLMSFPSDYDVVDPKHYEMEIDLRKANDALKTKMRIDLTSLSDNLRAIPMIINESMTAQDNKRLKHSMRVESAQYNGRDISCIQEDWESGLTFLLPEPIKKGEQFNIEVSMTGDYDNSRGESDWYPRHGFHKRSTFDLIFRHKKEHVVLSVGSLVREEEWPDDGGSRLTEYKTDVPVSFVSYIAGRMEPHIKNRKFEFGGMNITFSPPRGLIDEDLFLTELGNALDYFSTSFGIYPYKEFRSTLRPRPRLSGMGYLAYTRFDFVDTGKSYATLALLSSEIGGMNDSDIKSCFHLGCVTSGQWWGNLVAMKSRHDQWLRKGLTEYSGLLYVLDSMQNIESQKAMLRPMRLALWWRVQERKEIDEDELAEAVVTEPGQLVETSLSRVPYEMFSYKSALVLRMLHYLFSNPSTGEDSLFFEMLKDFAAQYAFKAASTRDFQRITNKHFPKTAIAKILGLKDLNWFFGQWLYEKKLPKYRMEYRIKSGEKDQYHLVGKVIQENVPKHWFMPLPVMLKFPGNQQARATVWAKGPETEIQIPSLAMKPDSVELDPDMWILSEKTETKKK